MEITCPRCQSLHEIEPPASARARGPRGLKFRCSHCGHTFSVDPDAAPAPAAAPPLLGEGPAGEPIQLVQIAGQIWSVPDAAALQRWILERRLDRDALVSRHGLRWARIGEREDLAMFFAAADAMSFQERNLRTEFPHPDEEIVVDAPEAESTDVEVGMPVATGPGPAVGGYRRGDLGTVVMDFEPREDTQEQTVRTDLHGSGLDETPIGQLPAGFDRVESMAEPTERMTVATATARDIPVPAGLSTVTPGPAPAGSAAHGTYAPPAPLAAAPPEEPALAPSAPVRVASSPSPVIAARIPAGPAAGPVPPTLVPAVTSPAPSASQGFFLDGSPANPAPPRRDVFDDPPTYPRPSQTNWAMWAGVASLVAVAAIAFAVLRPGSGEPPAKESKWQPPSAATAGRSPASTTGAAAAGAPADGAVGAPLPAATAPEAASPAATASASSPAASPSTRPAPSPAAAPAAPAAAPAVEAAAVKVPVAKVPAPEARAPAAKAPAARAPEATASSGGSPRKLVEQGWKAVEGGDFSKAHGLFDRALQGGSAPDALYGRGYANEKLGDSVSAVDDYCRALGGRGISVDIQREIEGSLRRLGRACP